MLAVKIRVQLPAPLPARRAYRPEGRAYSPEGGPGFGSPQFPAPLPAPPPARRPEPYGSESRAYRPEGRPTARREDQVSCAKQPCLSMDPIFRMAPKVLAGFMLSGASTKNLDRNIFE